MIWCVLLRVGIHANHLVDVKMADNFLGLLFILLLILIPYIRTDQSQCATQDLGFDTMFECNFAKECRDLEKPNKLGELRDYDDNLFNCYFGWTPFCVYRLPETIEKAKAQEFCEKRFPESTFITKKGIKACERRLDIISG